jgi:hypothetical protein
VSSGAVATASAEVVKVEVRKRIDEGRYERVVARVDYAVDPMLPRTSESPTSRSRHATRPGSWSSRAT